ncbi:MAG: recombinase family protein [Hespellia sp.]|nr:recombinase family protein [Hespellia sp.]
MARTSRKLKAAPGSKDTIVWKLALYVRLSIEDNGQKGRDSVSNQLELVRNFAEQMKDVSECYTYIDNGNTGTNFDRAQWEQLIADIKSKKVNCIVVKDLSRFARNYIEAGDYLEKIFPFLGVRFIAVNDCYDSYGLMFKENELTVSLKNLINDYYSKDISKKIMSSFRTKIENGEYIGNMAPYGYILKDNHFIVDSEAAEVVRRIFTLFTEGNSSYAIAKQLNSENIAAPGRYAYERGMKKYKKYQNVIWQQEAVTRILYNEVYTGKLIQGKTNHSKYQNEKIGLRPRESWIIIPDTHEPLVDDKTFQLVQNMRLKNQKKRQEQIQKKVKNKSENILKGYIFCGICGRPLRRGSTCRRGKAEYSYHCATVYNRSDAECTSISTSEKKVYAALLSNIRTQIDLAVEMNTVLQQIRGSVLQSNKYREVCEKISGETKEYQRLLHLKSTIYEDLKTNLLTKEEYILAKERYAQQIAHLEEQMEQSAKAKKLYEETLTNQNKWIQAFRKFQNAKNITREMIEALIEKIEMYPDRRMQITFRFSDEFNSVMSYVRSAQRKEGSSDGEISGRIS